MLAGSLSDLWYFCSLAWRFAKPNYMKFEKTFEKCKTFFAQSQLSIKCPVKINLFFFVSVTKRHSYCVISASHLNLDWTTNSYKVYLRRNLKHYFWSCRGRNRSHCQFVLQRVAGLGVALDICKLIIFIESWIDMIWNYSKLLVSLNFRNNCIFRFKLLWYFIGLETEMHFTIYEFLQMVVDDFKKALYLWLKNYYNFFTIGCLFIPYSHVV